MEFVTTKDKAKEWGVKEACVATYCRQNMIPNADKFDGNEWSIPKDAEKPFLTRHMARCFLEQIDVCVDGGEPDLPKTLYASVDDMRAGYEFLWKRGYCKRVVWGDEGYCDALSKSKVLKSGRDLIEADKAEYGKSKKTVTEKVEGEIKAGIGIAGGKAIGTRTVETEEYE